MNGKLPGAPLAGELLQIAGVLIVITTGVGLAVTHHWESAIALAFGILAFVAGRIIRRSYY